MTHKQLRFRRSRGLSLIEVMVATALLSVILLGLFGLVTQGVRRTYGGKKMTEATIIAQAVMERANVASPQTLLGAVNTASTATRTWSKTTNSPTTSSVTPASDGNAERDIWRTKFFSSNLPATTTSPATLTVTMDAMPSGRTFATAAAVRVVVDLTWWEWGTRQRQVRLQTLNARATSF